MSPLSQLYSASDRSAVCALALGALFAIQEPGKQIPATGTLPPKLTLLQSKVEIAARLRLSVDSHSPKLSPLHNVKRTDEMDGSMDDADEVDDFALQ